ncbi:MAG: hypothetical protein E7365_07475 [Clostridiales bacterium]|nr:hypothetical protein [Clostridiales bacterium]
MLYCDECKTIFSNPLIILYTDSEMFISKNIPVCPNCKNTDYCDVYLCKRCNKKYIKKDNFCADCINDLEKSIKEFLDNFTVEEQEIMLDCI